MCVCLEENGSRLGPCRRALNVLFLAGGLRHFSFPFPSLIQELHWETICMNEMKVAVTLTLLCFELAPDSGSLFPLQEVCWCPRMGSTCISGSSSNPCGDKDEPQGLLPAIMSSCHSPLSAVLCPFLPFTLPTASLLLSSSCASDCLYFFCLVRLTLPQTSYLLICYPSPTTWIWPPTELNTCLFPSLLVLYIFFFLCLFDCLYIIFVWLL